jgi:hypothetical protein
VEAQKSAVYLLQLEKETIRFPHATCFAVSNDTLITTAREAEHLVKMQREKGYKVYATQEGVKREVTEIRLYAPYSQLDEKTENNWLYYDLAVLKVEPQERSVVELAPAESLLLKEGQPLGAVGYSHDGNKITEFDKFAPQLAKGRVFLVTVPPTNLPGSPRLLHFQGNVSNVAFGTPVVNQDGQLVAVYVASAPPPAEGGAKAGPTLANLHYALIINPALIQRWTEQHDSTLWTLIPETKQP